MKFSKSLLLIVCLSISVVTLFGCSKKSDDEYSGIPAKISPSDNAANTSPINSYNLDGFLFQNEIKCVDLRSITNVIDDGYVSGFEFIPFYSIVASFSEGRTLYQMKNVEDGSGITIHAGQIGSYVAQYEESESIINSLFPKDKIILFMSQAGSESAYMINLLIQLGYDGNNLYNVGGVTSGEGTKAYISIDTNKYYVKGHNGYGFSYQYDFLDGLTSIE